MTKIQIKIPEFACGVLVYEGISERETSTLERLLILNYKVGSLNEHYLKQHKLQSKIQQEEFKMNLAEIFCHCCAIMVAERWDPKEMSELGWEKISTRWEDFEKTGVWADKVLTDI